MNAMNNKIDRTDAVTFALFGFASLVTAAVYPRLPARVPTHFNIHGIADGWMSKPIGATILLVTAAVTTLLVRFGASILPRGARERMSASPVKLVALLTMGLLVSLQLMIMYAALHDSSTIGRPLSIALGVYWIVLAQVLPRVRRNPFIGIRTAWTLSSDENWARTHRFGALSFTIGGVLALVAALAGLPAVAMIAVLVSALAPVVWSFVVAHRLPPT
jgi:uncharacterized membrane protein